MIAALVFTVASFHLNDSREYNQINPGLGVEWAISDRSHVGAGAYLNSSARLSVYGVVGTEYGSGPVRVGLEAGAVTGYDWPVLPLVFPYVAVRLKRWSVKVSVLPTKRPIVGIQIVTR